MSFWTPKWRLPLRISSSARASIEPGCSELAVTAGVGPDETVTASRVSASTLEDMFAVIPAATRVETLDEMTGPCP